MARRINPRQPKPFHERYVVTDAGCWEWQGAMSDTGYGSVNIGGYSQGAHRYAYKMFRGSIPDGLRVCHTCDNRKCVNPDHLFLGTAKDNSIDMVRKGRNVAHEKLTAEQVATIRAAFATGSVTKTELGRRFGVSRSAIGHIIRGTTWKKAA